MLWTQQVSSTSLQGPDQHACEAWDSVFSSPWLKSLFSLSGNISVWEKSEKGIYMCTLYRKVIYFCSVSLKHTLPLASRGECRKQINWILWCSMQLPSPPEKLSFNKVISPTAALIYNSKVIIVITSQLKKKEFGLHCCSKKAA